MLFWKSERRRKYIKDYLVGRYAKFWVNQVKKYGYMPYHQSMISLIESFKPQLNGLKMLECGIGTGYPFAMKFAKQGWHVFGVDIARRLINECCQNARNEGFNISSNVGDIEALPYKESAFDMTYCLQTTWYITNLKQAITEMVRVTKPGGYIVFDIMNMWSFKILRIRLVMWWHWLFGLPKMFTKRMIRGATIRIPMWEENPIIPLKVNRVLRNLGVKYYTTTPDGIAGYERLELLDWFHYRLVYICQKWQ